ncbi:hypothetical protein L1049_028238 [Liquidambar formosana]|uniref:Reverse transcriptase n=1 Tax=Liquidambar formosana TaxID=63359 RepID=A0AAP0WT43_LIQFO
MAIKSVLDRFCNLSELKVSFPKSKVFCSPNTNPELIKDINDVMCIPNTHTLGKYLGFPILHGRKSKAEYKFIEDKAKCKLAGWKASLLSMAGRTTLVKSVLAAIPNYYMQTTALPVSICNSLDKMTRDFIWGSTTDHRKVHLVGWDTVTKPRNLGGLGIRRTAIANKVCLAKLNWNLAHDTKPWAQALKAKYQWGNRKSLETPYWFLCGEDLERVLRFLKLIPNGMLKMVRMSTSGKIYGIIVVP